MHAIQIDEADRLVWPVPIRHARAQRPCHEHQMRIRIPRLFWFLRIGELGSSLELVVLVPGALREHRPENVDVGHYAVSLLIQARRKALIEVACGRMEGTAKRPRIRVERAAVAGGDHASNVDNVDPGAWSKLECELDGGE
jgi:hypothetical protein